MGPALHEAVDCRLTSRLTNNYQQHFNSKMPSKNKAVHHHQVVAPLHMKGRELGEDNEDDEREVDEIKRLDGKSSGVYLAVRVHSTIESVQQDRWMDGWLDRK